MQETEDTRDKVDVLLSRDTFVSQRPVFSRPLWPPSCVWEVIRWRWGTVSLNFSGESLAWERPCFLRNLLFICKLKNKTWPIGEILFGPLNVEDRPVAALGFSWDGTQETVLILHNSLQRGWNPTMETLSKIILIMVCKRMQWYIKLYLSLKQLGCLTYGVIIVGVLFKCKPTCRKLLTFFVWYV